MFEPRSISLPGERPTTRPDRFTHTNIGFSCGPITVIVVFGRFPHAFILSVQFSVSAADHERWSLNFSYHIICGEERASFGSLVFAHVVFPTERAGGGRERDIQLHFSVVLDGVFFCHLTDCCSLSYRQTRTASKITWRFGFPLN